MIKRLSSKVHIYKKWGRWIAIVQYENKNYRELDAALDFCWRLNRVA